MRLDVLPKGWSWKRVGEVADVAGGLTKHAERRQASERIVPLVSVAAVQLRAIAVDRVSEIGLLPEDGDTGKLIPGDVLVVEGNGSLAHIGRVALWSDEVPEARHQNHIIRLRPRDVVPKFLLEWMASPLGRDAIVAEATSASGLYTLSLSKVARLPIPVPPLDVQRRIVAKLDELLAKSRAAREQLEAVPSLVEKYRQSVLAAAFRGDLTADWRKKNPNVEPASKLLERIRLERRKAWETAELAKMQAKGKVPKDDKWKAKYVEPAPVDPTGLPELPPTWCWASIEELCPFDAPAVYGIIQPGEHVDGGVPYVRPLDIGADGTVVLNDLKRTSASISEAYARSRLRAGDIVLSIVGTIGKVLVVGAELDGANITQSSIRIRPPSEVPTRFVEHVLQAPLLRRQYDKYRFGNAVQRLNVEHVRRLAVPVAPEREAQVVSTMLKNRLEVVKRMVIVGSDSMGALERTLLATALRGELDLDGRR